MPSLLLKWGVPKGWNGLNESQQNKLQEYYDLGSSMSAMAQPNTDAHKKILCEFIDMFDGEITSDWSGESMTKEQAKDYVINYGKQKGETN